MNTIQNELSLLPIDEQTHKHRCMVRQLLAWRHEWGLKKFQAFINKPNWEKMWNLHKADFAEQFTKGNKGESGVWL